MENNNKFRGLQLKDILKERNQNEDEDFCIDTNYFGFGSFENLKNAHLNEYVTAWGRKSGVTLVNKLILKLNSAEQHRKQVQNG